MIEEINSIDIEITDYSRGYKIDGHLYPEIQLRLGVCNKQWFVLDETGWDGFRETERSIVSQYKTRNAAIDEINKQVDEVAEYYE